MSYHDGDFTVTQKPSVSRIGGFFGEVYHEPKPTEKEPPPNSASAVGQFVFSDSEDDDDGDNKAAPTPNVRSRRAAAGKLGGVTSTADLDSSANNMAWLLDGRYPFLPSFLPAFLPFFLPACLPVRPVCPSRIGHSSFLPSFS
jgi:hypothetical protein